MVAAVSALGSWWAGLGAGTQTVLGGVASAAVGAGVNAALQPKIPGAKPVTSMPDPEEVRRNASRQFLTQYGRGGRASTILTDNSGDNALG